MAQGYAEVKLRAYGRHKQRYKSFRCTHTPTHHRKNTQAFAYTLMPTEVKPHAYQQANAERRAPSENDLSASHSVPCSRCILDLYIQQRFPFENCCSALLRGAE